jgi:hypothetical protein
MVNQPTLRDIIKEETKKCMEDPAYFMRKYVKIQHPTRGTILFDLYPFQEDTLKEFDLHRYILILKSRQLGITTLIAAYSLWMSIFNSDKNILIISIKQEVSKEIITKVRFANEHLPSWLKVKETTNNYMSLRFANGSQVAATSSAKDAGRSKALSLLIIDEAAFIEESETIWASSYNTLSTGGKAIVLSTPNGVGNWFHKMWVDAERKKNDFKTLRLSWNLHPERDQKWRDEQTKQLGAKLASQECDGDFLSSGANVVDLITLKWYEENPEMVRDRKEARSGEALWIFEEPMQGKDYLVCADVARGDGSDFSAAHVFDIETLEQVVEFQDQIGTREFGNMLVYLATEYNDALLIVERENIGWAVLQQIIDRQYKNTFYSNTNDPKIADVYHNMSNRYNRDEAKLLPGFSTTIKTRPLLVSKIEEYFREKLVIIHSIRLINELKTFIWENGKAQAAQNYNDDLVLALGMGLWVRDTALRLRNEKMVLTKNMLDKIHINKNEDRTPIYTAKVQSTGRDQWQMKFGKRPGDVESLTWLLR